MKALTLLSIALLHSAVTLGGTDKPYVGDLILPFLNLSLLFSFIFFKGRQPLSRMFSRKAEDVEQFYTSTQMLFKEASSQHALALKQLSSLEKEISKIISQNEEEVAKLQESKKKELVKNQQKIDASVVMKLKGDRENLLLQVKEEVAENIFLEVRERVRSSDGCRAKILQKLLLEVQGGL